MGGWNGWSLNNHNDFIRFFYYCTHHPEDTEANDVMWQWINAIPRIRQWYDQWKLEYDATQAHSGENEANDIYGEYNAMGATPSGEMEKYLDNSVAQGNTEVAQNYEREMRDTSLLSSAAQLGQLGLSSSGVLSVGGASSNGVGAAQTSHLSAAGLKNQRDMAKYQARMGLAKQVIGMVGQMASSGIYGHAIGAARHAGAVLASATAHSGLKALQSYRPSISEDEIRKFMDTGKGEGIPDYKY